MSSNQYVANLKAALKANKKSLMGIEEEMGRGCNNNACLIPIYQKAIETLDTELRGLKIRDRVEKHGINYDEWWQWAQSLYKISCVPGVCWKVTSLARDWQQELFWDFGDEISCKEKIEELCGYKIYDRKRGRGDMEQDLTKGA